MRALRDSKRHHAVNTERGEHEPQRSKTRKQHHAEAIDRQRLAHDLVNRFHTRKRQIRIDRIHCGRDALNHAP